MGSRFDDVKTIQVRVASVDVHPRYLIGQAYYDVAIMRLTTPVEINDYVLPVCLPEVASEDPDVYSGKLVTLTGWGLQVRNGLRDNHHLQRVHMGVFSQRQDLINTY